MVISKDAIVNFCGSEQFWVYYYNETSNSTEFSLEPCLMKTAFAWTPILFLWLFSPLEYFYFIKKVEKATSPKVVAPINWLCKIKLDLIHILLLLSSLGCISLWYSSKMWKRADLLTSIFNIPTLILVKMLTEKNTQCGYKSSGVIFIFWLLYSLLPVPQLAFVLGSHIRKEKDITSCLYFGSCVVAFICFIVNFFAETKEDEIPKSYEEEDSIPNQENNYSFPSRLLFTWMFPIIKKGSEKIEKADLWKLSPDNSVQNIDKLFKTSWNDVVRNQSAKASRDFILKNPVLLALLKTFWKPFLFASFMKLICSVLLVLLTKIKNELFTNLGGSSHFGYTFILTVSLTSTAILLYLVEAQQKYKISVVELRVQSALNAAIFRKAMTISPTADASKSVGDLVNMCTTDVTLVLNLISNVNQLWSVPFVIGGCIYFMWPILGPSVLAGMLVIMGAVLIQAVIVYCIAEVYKIQMNDKDNRLNLTFDVLSGFKVVKMNNWDANFEGKILDIRKLETKRLKWIYYLRALSIFIIISIHGLIPLAVFLMYTSSGDYFTFNMFFSVAVFFNAIGRELYLLPNAVVAFSQSKVSLKRIYDFLNANELSEDAVTHQTTESEVVTVKGSFAWKEVFLKNIDLHVNKGCLVVVVGPVGSGKTSLLSAILGEMVKTEVNSSVNIQGSISYAPQKSWLQTMSVKDNIISLQEGGKYSQARLKEVVQICQLAEEIYALSKKDDSEIGEQGGCLSGGQKQRLNLARTLYPDSDLYLLDDPLSAIDSQVGKLIYEEVIASPKAYLKKKTRIMTTQNINYLKYADKVILMDEGKIAAQGTLKQVKETIKGREFFESLPQNDDDTVDARMPELKEDEKRLYVIEDCSTSIQTNTSHQPTSRLGSHEDLQPLIKKENFEEGNVKGAVYSHYLRSVSFCSLALICMLILIENMSSLLSGYYLSLWAYEVNVTNLNTKLLDNMTHLQTSTGYAVFNGLVTAIVQMVLFKVLLDVSHELHKKMLRGVIRSPVSFMEANLQGRVGARFSRDMEILDFELPSYIYTFFSQTVQVPLMLYIFLFHELDFGFGSGGVVVGALYVFLVMQYLKTSRQLRRLESVSRSPVYSHLKESYLGASVIRAFKAKETFIEQFEKKVDLNQQCNYLLTVSQIFANLWLNLIAQLIGLGLTLYIIIRKNLFGESQSQILILFSIQYLPWFLSTIMSLIQAATELHTDIVAVERIKEYSELPQEESNDLPKRVRAEFKNTKLQYRPPAGDMGASLSFDTDLESGEQKKCVCKIPEDWPSRGEIEFDNYSTRYESSAADVLSELTFTIKPGEKVGIVGRTGAGKSTLVSALARIIKLEEESSLQGRILIDGVDISTIPISRLRKSLNIIPQDPVLFTGSLRMNLDPTGNVPIEELRAAVDKARLRTFLNGEGDAVFDQHIEGAGATLSMGQRQLICLGRALLRKTKVLILDEATAAVDLKTERHILDTIQAEFDGCTIISIAHRLSTVINHDRILVMARGKKVEFGVTKDLLENEQSIFYNMVNNKNAPGTEPTKNPLVSL